MPIRSLSKVISIIWINLFLLSTASASEVWSIDSTYSRGNDDLNEANHETARIFISLAAYDRPGNMLELVLRYEAILSTDHPHGISGGDYSLKQRFNDIEPNLSATEMSYTPGPNGSPLGGVITGSIVLGEISRTAIGPRRGRLDVTLLPDYDPNHRSPVDSAINWGIHMAGGEPVLGHITLQPEWKGPYRAPDELLRLIDSSFIPQSAWRDRFPH